MTDLRVAPIVEGHGDVASVRILLDRTWRELLGGVHIEVLKPIRMPRSLVTREHELLRRVDYAMLKLEDAGSGLDSVSPGIVLLMVDAEPQLGCELAPQITAVLRNQQRRIRFACALPDPEYETWFVAAAESLGQYLDLSIAAVPTNPDRRRVGKGWVQRAFRGVSYSETLEQPRMTAAMDLALARSRSRSFDKLCRELEVWKSASRA